MNLHHRFDGTKAGMCARADQLHVHMPCNIQEKIMKNINQNIYALHRYFIANPLMLHEKY
jgi:hypothetical protein